VREADENAADALRFVPVAQSDATSRQSASVTAAKPWNGSNVISAMPRVERTIEKAVQLGAESRSTGSERTARTAGVRPRREVSCGNRILLAKIYAEVATVERLMRLSSVNRQDHDDEEEWKEDRGKRVVA
jgi:hypothetical protein